MAIVPTLKLYSQGPYVRILQMNLYGINYNYNGLKINSVFDLLTDEVVRDFQAENKLVSDGVVGPVTWNVLFGKVIRIQNKLNSLNINAGISDGVFGPKTIDAVRRFQSANGLITDGVVNPRTRQQLFNPNTKDDYSTRPSSTSLSALNPYVASLAKKFIDVCTANNLNVRVLVTFRSWDEQDVLYAQGRTKPGNIVTDAKGGESYHNWGLAFDCAPVTNGLIDWNAMDKFIIMGSLGQQVGLEWGGNWITFKINLVDTPHYQYTFGLSTEQLLDGVRPPQ